MCPESVCYGSIMMPNLHARKPEDVRSKEELLKLATDFIDQYYTSIKRYTRAVPSILVSQFNWGCESQGRGIYKCECIKNPGIRSSSLSHF